MKLLILCLFSAACCSAQFRTMELTFKGIGCASCVASLPERIKRMRGVESATVDSKRWVLEIHLAEQNRVRLEQVRDAIEQDGTKVVQAKVTIKGAVAQENGRTILRPEGSSAEYLLAHSADSSPGVYTVSGEVARVRPDSGPIVINATDLQRAQ